MATTVERTTTTTRKSDAARSVTPSLSKVLAVVAIGLAGWALAARIGGGAAAAGILRSALSLTWALAGLVLALRRPSEPLGALVSATAAVAAVGILVHPLARAVIPLLPAAGMHLLIGLPAGELGTSARRTLAIIGYALAAGLAAFWLA